MPRPARATSRRCTRRRATTPSAADIVAGSSGLMPRRLAQDSGVRRAALGRGATDRDAVDLVQLGDELDLDRRDRGDLDRELDRDGDQRDRHRPLQAGQRPAADADGRGARTAPATTASASASPSSPGCWRRSVGQVAHRDPGGGVDDDVGQPAAAGDRAPSRPCGRSRPAPRPAGPSSAAWSRRRRPDAGRASPGAGRPRRPGRRPTGAAGDPGQDRRTGRGVRASVHRQRCPRQAAHSWQTGWPPTSLASWLRWCTRKQREQVNSSAWRGSTRTESSSLDRSAPGSSKPRPPRPRRRRRRRRTRRRAAPSAPRGSPRRARRRSCAGCRSRWPLGWPFGVRSSTLFGAQFVGGSIVRTLGAAAVTSGPPRFVPAEGTIMPDAPDTRPPGWLPRHARTIDIRHRRQIRHRTRRTSVQESPSRTEGAAVPVYALGDRVPSIDPTGLRPPRGRRHRPGRGSVPRPRSGPARCSAATASEIVVGARTSIQDGVVIHVGGDLATVDRGRLRGRPPGPPRGLHGRATAPWSAPARCCCTRSASGPARWWRRAPSHAGHRRTTTGAGRPGSRRA